MSCTGGILSHLLTELPGALHSFMSACRGASFYAPVTMEVIGTPVSDHLDK